MNFFLIIIIDFKVIDFVYEINFKLKIANVLIIKEVYQIDFLVYIFLVNAENIVSFVLVKALKKIFDVNRNLNIHQKVSNYYANSKKVDDIFHLNMKISNNRNLLNEILNVAKVLY